MVAVPCPGQLPTRDQLCSGGRPYQCTYQGLTKEYQKVGHDNKTRTLPLHSENSQRLLNHPTAQGYYILKHIACFRRTSARKCCQRNCRIPFPIMGLGSARVRNQAEGEEAGGGSGRAASSRTATDSNPPSGAGRGGAPSTQLKGSPELPAAAAAPNQGSPMAINQNPPRTSL